MKKLIIFMISLWSVVSFASSLSQTEAIKIVNLKEAEVKYIADASDNTICLVTLGYESPSVSCVKRKVKVSKTFVVMKLKMRDEGQIHKFRDAANDLSCLIVSGDKDHKINCI